MADILQLQLRPNSLCNGTVVTHLPPTSEIRVRIPARPQVGKLVDPCCWSAVYSTVPWTNCMYWFPLAFQLSVVIWPVQCWKRCIYLFGVLRRFQHCTGHNTTGSWKGRRNQYILFVRVLYCKLPTNGKQLPAFTLEAVPWIKPRPQTWEARELPLCHCGPWKRRKTPNK